MKTNELIGDWLDYYVAKAEGHNWRYPWMLSQGKTMKEWQSSEEAWGNPTPPYSISWACGGPIIGREEGTFQKVLCDDDNYLAFMGERNTIAFGPTHLVAAMRAYVVSKFGDEVPEGE